jgi:aminopeptidase N
MFWRFLPVLPASLVLGSCLADAAPAPTETGVPLELAELRRRTLSDVRYDVRLSVPEDRAQPVTGETTVRFVWDDMRARDVALDFLDPAARVRSVRVNGVEVEWRPENDHVVIPADALRGEAQNEIRLIYAAGDEALNRSAEFMYTLFVPERHHFSLPVFDQPDLKARWRLQLEVPGNWVAVANGAEEVDSALTASVAPATTNGPRRLYRFAETQPIPSYLFAFAAGRFRVEESELEGRRLRMFHRETDAQRIARNREQIFTLHRTALAWMEEYTQIAYPFDKLDFVLIPTFQYGGMEHPGAIFYRQDGLLLDESATQADQLARASVIAHETAHMWFGDLVTMTWFDDVWTKEVFASFMAAKIVHPSFPELDHDLRFLLANQPAAYAVDRTAGTNAIRQPLENLREAGSLYGAIIYQKAPVVMRQLEERVGEPTFREGMRAYLKEFAYGNATWPELVEILDDLSAQELQEWTGWRRRAGPRSRWSARGPRAARASASGRATPPAGGASGHRACAWRTRTEARSASGRSSWARSRWCWKPPASPPGCSRTAADSSTGSSCSIP